MSFRASLRQLLFFSSYNCQKKCKTIEKGVEKTTSNKITIQRSGEVLYAKISNKHYYDELSDDNINNFSNIFSNAAFKTKGSYRDIKNDPEWKSLYDVFNDQYPWVDLSIDVIKDVDTDLVYCRGCGILMPLKLATVDHQKPQSGGGVEAMCRFFRALGLTMSFGKGPKSLRMNHLFAAQVGGNVGDNSMGMMPIGDKESRYSLTLKGELYLSLLNETGLYQQFMDVCMHSIFNLRPVCGPCNSKLKNSNVGMG